uniref:DBR1 domain-containing protein n=1 Tax=Echinostoma caproni TaxID=27848 RepID=A0A183B3D7_9TREM
LQNGSDFRPSPGTVLHQLLAEIEQNPDSIPSVAEFRAGEQFLKPDDDESWLYITPDELDAMLLDRAGLKPGESCSANRGHKYKDKGDHDKQIPIAQLLDKLVGASSSYEGIEVNTTRSGSKRKSGPGDTNEDALTEDDDSGEGSDSDDAKPWDLMSEDSEDGFAECSRAQSKGKGQQTESMNMYDMMRSLLSKMGRSLFAFHSFGEYTN